MRKELYLAVYGSDSQNGNRYFGPKTLRDLERIVDTIEKNRSFSFTIIIGSAFQVKDAMRRYLIRELSKFLNEEQLPAFILLPCNGILKTSATLAEMLERKGTFEVGIASSRWRLTALLGLVPRLEGMGIHYLYKKIRPSRIIKEFFALKTASS